VDKGVNNRHLTAENACNGGRYNKMPNPQANFLPHKINHLQTRKSAAPAPSRQLEKKYFVHKWEARHRCVVAQGIL
jgi:hypothetical protein